MSKLDNVELNKLEKKKIIITNTIKMLNIRINNKDTNIDKIINSFDNILNDDIFNFNINNSKYSIYISNEKLSSINKSLILKSFLENYDINKIVVIREPSKKVYKQIIEYGNTEFWFLHELLIDLYSHNCVPKHIPLTKDETEIYYKEYGNTGMSKIQDTDPMSRYFKLKPDDIVKIIRPTTTSGYAPFYRKVVPGKIDDLSFD